MGKFNRGHIHSAKKTPSEILEMRRLYAEERWSQGRLARHFQLSVGQVGRIVRGEAWQQFQQTPHQDEMEASQARFLASLDTPPVEIAAEEAQLLADIGTLARMAEKEQPQVDAVAEFMKKRGKGV